MLKRSMSLGRLSRKKDKAKTPDVELGHAWYVLTPAALDYRIRPNRHPGRLRKFVPYHYCQKIVNWAIISENKVKSQEKDRQVGDDKWKYSKKSGGGAVMRAGAVIRSNTIHVLWHHVQWNSSCEATLLALKMWPFKRGALSAGVTINTFMFRFTLSSGLFRGVASPQGGLSEGVPLYLLLYLVSLRLRLW